MPSRPTERPFVCFDLGQTLVDLRDLLASIAALLAARFPALASSSKDLSEEWIQRSEASLPRRDSDPFVPEFPIAIQTLVNLLATRGVSVESDDAGRFLQDAWNEFETGVRFCPGISSAWLRNLRGFTRGMAIVTDGDDENVYRLVRRLRLGPLFDVIVTSEAVKAYKPNPRIYEFALQSLGADASESLFVSDSPLDLRGAVDVGMQTAWIVGSSPRPSERPPERSFVLHSPRELDGILKSFVLGLRSKPASEPR